MRTLTHTLLLSLMVSLPVAADDYFTNIMSVIQPVHSQTALIAKDLSSGKVIYEKNADALFLPASTLKILTAVSASAQLGTRFRFNTEIFSNIPLRGGHIAGDIYISFSGDPTLTSYDLRSLFKQLTSQGLNRIEGNVYLVGAANDELQAPGWVWDDLGICFAAPVSSYTINQNCIRGELKPLLADNKGKLSFPSYYPVTISSDVVFDKTGSRKFCDLSLKRLPDNAFHLGGCFSGNQPVKLAIAITDPQLYAQETLTQILATSHIKVMGQVLLAASRPGNAVAIASHSSKALPQLLDKMLLKSDNLIADSLLKQIGQNYYARTGTFGNGSAAMRAILTDLGIDLTHAQIVDGSGLSRYNLISAHQLSEVLELIYHDSRFAYLIESLPVAGVSGTLQYRASYTKAPLKDHVQAKTGSMQGVANLAGFLKQESKANTLFVVLENGLSPSSKNTQAAPFSVLFLQSLLEGMPDEG